MSGGKATQFKKKVHSELLHASIRDLGVEIASFSRCKLRPADELSLAVPFSGHKGSRIRGI